MTKTDLIFPAFSSRFVDFAVQFCFRCNFSFNEVQRSSQVDSGAIFVDQLQFFAMHSTNEIASFCINHRSRQMSHMAFFESIFLSRVEGRG